MNKIVLASASPRRKELLKLIADYFEVFPDNSPEKTDGINSVSECVCALSEQKCFNVADKFDDEYIVIGADTVVSVDGRILGKPKNRQEAAEMLMLLSGRQHSVYTGVTVMQKSINKAVTFFEKTDVYFYDIEDEIEKYIESGEPMDKAGAYGIQGKGALFVKKINGDYNNVVGLPAARLSKVLKESFNYVK